MQQKFNEQWQPYSSEQHALIPPALLPWLLHAHSFMERVKSRGFTPRIQVLSEAWQSPFLTELACLGLSQQASTLIREVFISTGSTILMYARTVIPKIVLTGKETKLANLGDRSLGSILFQDSMWQRHEFEIAHLNPTFEVMQCILLHVNIAQDLWARRSLFTAPENKKLLLTEVFFPASAVYGND